MKRTTEAWLTNGDVAWQIPDEVAWQYLRGYYLPPAGWQVVKKLGHGWCQGKLGEMRRCLKEHYDSRLPRL